MSADLAKRAQELYVPGIVGYKQVAKILGVSPTTVRRYTDPDFAERLRRSSREAKLRRTGTCERCGGETRYNGRRVNGPSSLCVTCNTRPWTHCARGHELTPENRVRVNRGGGFTCRICRNEYMRELQARRRREAGVLRRRNRRQPIVQPVAEEAGKLTIGAESSGSR